MIRIIDLKSYLPPFLLEYKELNKILSVDNVYLQAVENTHWKLIDNRFFETCDTDGIARFEKMIGITPLDTDTLEDRIFRVKTKWNKELPYNYRYLIEQLESLVGASYDVDLDTANLTVTVRIGVGTNSMYDSVAEMLDGTLPCNIVWVLIQLYNTYNGLHKHSYSKLLNYTYEGLVETVIE